jgi:hypothetical protein
MAVVMVVLLCHVTLMPVATAFAKEEGSTEPTESQGGMGIASVLASIPYGLAKVCYALMGGIIGGFTYVLSGFDEKPAKKVWDASIRGDYVITPDHLRGDKPVRFVGLPRESEPSAQSTSSAEAATSAEPAPAK